jgi:hypothetical protein
MSIYELGPGNGTLSIRTERTGAAAKAGHNLVIEVTVWQATFEAGAEPRIVVDVDPTSLRVREGTGGIQALGDDDRASIEETIDAEILERRPIGFRSSAVEGDGGRLAVQGELTLAGTTRPLAFDVTLGDDRVGGTVVIRQSDWGISPYSTLFGTLKVVDDVEIVFDVALPAQSA